MTGKFLKALKDKPEVQAVHRLDDDINYSLKAWVGNTRS
jgi:hypothetical protein